MPICGTLSSLAIGVDEAGRALALAAITFFPTGGGQPHDPDTPGFASGAMSVLDLEPPGQVRGLARAAEAGHA